MGSARLLLYLLMPLLLPDGAVRGAAIVGAGSSLPAQVLADAQFAYRFANPNVELEYYASDSQAGVCRLESFPDQCDATDTSAPPGLDFAVTTTVLSQRDYQAYPDLQLYPVLATPLVPVYNVNGTQGLVLDLSALALIFCGVITTWDDSRIKFTNANFHQWSIPPRTKIQVVARLDASDVTLLFKTALNGFYSPFARFVEISPRPSWGSLNVVLLEGQEAVNSYVLQNPWTISYSSLEAAIDANVARVPIWKSAGVVVDASVKTTMFAMLELGLGFGSNGDNETHLTADLNNAIGVNGWPIVTYTYLALRRATLRAGASCATVRDTVAFWHWFLTAGVTGSIAEAHFSVQPPRVVLDIVVQRLVSDVTCRGLPVYQAQQMLHASAVGEANIARTILGLAETFALQHPQLSLQYTPSSLTSPTAVADALAANQFVAVRQPSLAPARGTATLLFAGVAVVVISQYDLVLNVTTLARILAGDIQTWLDPDLVALNPNGFATGQGGSGITNASQPIVLFNGPTSNSAEFQELMQRHVPGCWMAALQAAPLLRTEEQLRAEVAGTPYALAVTTSAHYAAGSSKFARLQRAAGTPVAPTPAAVGACAASASYSASAGLDLDAASDPACYPLVFPVYLIVQTPQCPTQSNATDDPDSVQAVTLAFLLWAFGDDMTNAALQDYGLALLADGSPTVKAANAVALAALSCRAADDAANGSSINIAVIISGCVGGLFFFTIPGLWYARKSRRHVQALQKQVSDVKVAEDCAEAIACFDLEAVSWLSDLPKPTKIQLAFRRIVALLVDVKPFVPDQLVAQLQAAKKRDALPREQSHQAHLYADDARTGSTASASVYSAFSSSRTAVSLHDPVGQGRQVHVSSADDASRAPVAGRVSRISLNADSGSHVDRFHRTCTFMYVRFVIGGQSVADEQAQLATTVASHVVMLGKVHGATIDKVTYDSVALHWNVSAQCTRAPLQAVMLAMELACTQQLLLPGASGDLRLLVGIGHGPSTVATVSAAGQRFFVVGGPEITNATEVVMREVALPLGCTLLLSDAVKQEVKYDVRCRPRVWYRDVLFWEPVERRAGCAVDDEWMYQLQRMDEDDSAQEVGRALHRVFLLAHAGQSPSVLQCEIHHVQRHFSEQLNAQDLASLRHLHDACMKDGAL